LILSFAQLASTIYHPQATSILNYSFKERLHSAIGIHGALGAVGLMVFPILLSKSSDLFGWRISPTLVYTPFVVIVIILIPLVVRDTEKTDKTGFNLGLIRKNWLPISMLSLYSGLHTMAFLNNSLFLPLYLSSFKNFDIVQIGLWIGISGIGNILGQAIIGFGAEKFGTRKLILVTSILYGVFFYGFLSINNDLFQLLLLILFSSVNAASFPLVMSITTEIVNKESVTVTMGIVQSITGITRVIISPIMGYLADEVGLVFTMTLALIPVTLGGFVALWIRKQED
jgi:predicted MFS family arabinose efflux permease